MARIFKNNTESAVVITCANKTRTVPGADEFDLSEDFTPAELQACDGLVELLGQGVDKYQLNDGVNDLSVSKAIDLLRGYQPTQVKITTSKASGDGSPILAFRKPDAPKLTFITPNWCDRTTWYSSSVYVADEVAGDSGDHTTYNLDHQDVIDTYHGKITFEDFLKDSEGRSYRVVVKVDDVVKIEQDPHFGTDGDFTIDYAAGTITFLLALQSTEAVTVTYHYANSSTFTVAPIAGKILRVETVEVQCSNDLQMNDTFIFQAYGLVDVFAPQLMPGVPSGTKIPLGDPLKYKTINDIVNDSNHSYPAYPVLGGAGWRANKSPLWIFCWDYNVGSTLLYAGYGMEVRVSLEHDTPCGGTLATATLYCTSTDE